MTVSVKVLVEDTGSEHLALGTDINLAIERVVMLSV